MSYYGPMLIKKGSPGSHKFGVLLKELCRLNGLRAKVIAENVGISESFVTGIERGDQAPSMDVAKKILSCMQKNHGIEWKDEGPYQLLMRDPESNKDVAFIFTHKVGGRGQKSNQNKTSTYDMILRLECIAQANITLSKKSTSPEEIIRTAKRYEEFLRNGN